MPRTGLTQQELRLAALDAAEAAIRRHGIDRFRMVDVAQQLDVTHSALYKVFADKGALMDAVSDRWLVDIEADLQAISARPGPTMRKLRDWFVRLHLRKREKVKADPELYAAFGAAASGARPFIDRHLAVMRGQLEHMLAEGMRKGELARASAKATAEALFLGTAAFHHPAFVAEHAREDRVPQLRKVLDLMLAGMHAASPKPEK
jgi:AcrR family transcriptional regulator